MKKLSIYILLATVLMVVNVKDVHANPCASEVGRYVCSGYTVDFDPPSFFQKLINTAQYFLEKLNKVGNAILSLGQTNSVEGGGDASVKPVHNLNLPPSPMPNSNALSVMVQRKGNVSAGEVEAVNMGTSGSQDKVARTLVLSNFVKPDTSIAAGETLVKNREAFFVAGIFEGFGVAYDATKKMDDIKKLANKVFEAAEEDKDLNGNIRYRAALNSFSLGIESQIAKVQGERIKLKIREDMYLSPTFTVDATSAAQAGEGSTTGRAR